MATLTLNQIFTEEAMTKPLFVEPTDEVAREDPFVGPQGFMIGGMSLPTRGELSQQYFDAAHVLLHSIKAGAWEDYKLVNPCLFLYRHSLELLLKDLLRSTSRSHSLSALVDELDALNVKNFGKHVPEWIKSRLKEMGMMDQASTAFRYAQNFDKASKSYVAVDGEIYVSLPHLEDAMLAIYTALSGQIPEIVREYPPSI